MPVFSILNLLISLPKHDRQSSVRRRRVTCCTGGAWLLITAFFLCPSMQLSGQPLTTLTGQWQGGLGGVVPTRILLKLGMGDAGHMQGSVYLLDGDDPASPHAIMPLNIHDRELSFRIQNLDVSFTGALDADGAWRGTWTQHGATSPLKLMHVSADTAWPVATTEGRSMPDSADPAFEVATIRPADPNDSGRGFQLLGQHVHVRNETLQAIICFAYNIHHAQLQGEPPWLAVERWEIDGLPDTPGSPTLKQMRAMYRKLLTERFALAIHRENKELHVYQLQVGRGGSKLTKSLGAPNGPPDSTGDQNAGISDMRYTNISLDEFAQDLAYSEDRPIVNNSHLSGRYDFRLRWASADAATASQNVATSPPPLLFTAVREQLGLSLSASLAKVDVYVIAHVARPSAN